MPSDIRNFFGGKDAGIISSQDKDEIENFKSTRFKSKARGKRKVVSDSEDDEESLKPKHSTPKRKTRRHSPIGVETTSSDYFAVSKAKPHDELLEPLPGSISGDGTAFDNTTRGVPKVPSDRVSPRQKKKTRYAKTKDHDEKVEPEENLLKSTPISGRNVDVEKPRAQDLESGSEKATDLDEIHRDERHGLLRSKKVKSEVSQTAKHKAHNGHTANGVDDADLKNYNEAKPVRISKAFSSRRGKSAESEGQKIGAKIKNGHGTELASTQAILDSIPTICPPSPPGKIEDKKFDFRAQAHRSEPAPAAGSKQIPVGAENCLAGLSFVFTGILDALGREEGIELVKRYGGKNTTAPSSKTDYVVLGNDAGPKKLETIAKHKLKVINEDGLFELIRRLPANGGDSKAASKYEEKKQAEVKKVLDLAAEMEEQERTRYRTQSDSASVVLKSGPSKLAGNARSITNSSELWTVKYAPSATSMICGNKGQVEKLQSWLRAWHSNARTNFKKAGKDGSGVYRAIMIHGPPGIGKTTAAHLVANLEGYDIVESNASDTRSKKLVETGLRGVLDTTSLLGYFAGDGQKVDAARKKLVLIMDEVDGMSAGDRGGVGAMATVCKKTKIPMILICNDRRLPKMRPFDQATYDLPFRKPTVEMIRARIMTICFREGLKIPPNVINALIEGSNADIRQIINMISTAKLDQEAMDFNQGKQMSDSWQKHVILKPWDIVGKILGGGMFAAVSKSTLNEKIELYFNDHDFSSLMLQENYLGTNPMLSSTYTGREKGLKILELTDKAAESISDGDLVDRIIHGSQQQWSLMPTHAVFSFVRPASFVSGSLAGNQTRFTSWLGNNSKQGKLSRFVKEIQGHMRLRASGDAHEIRQQYLPLLWYRLVKELADRGKDGLDEIIELMDSYFLTKDDWDAIVELGVGPMDYEKAKIGTQTRAAFTRIYNQRSHPLPFMKASNILAPKKASREKPDLEEAVDASDEGDDALVDEALDDEEEALDLKKDKYVKVPKKKATLEQTPAKRSLGKNSGKAKLGQDDYLVDEEIINEDDVNPRKDKEKAKAPRAKVKGKK